MTEILPVTFDANGGKFENFTAPDTATSIVKEVEYDGTLTEKPENPTKDRETFKGWATEANGKPLSEEDFKAAIKNIKEAKTFYAIYGKASAKISYLDLDGKAIDDKFKFGEIEYPVDKEGKAGTVVDKAEYTENTAPKFLGYKFNRVELNPKDAKYAFENQATIKIYYEELRDIIPQKENGQINAQPDGYVKLEFLKGKSGELDGETIYYVNPKKVKHFSEITTRPNVIPSVGYKHDSWTLGEKYEFKVEVTYITAMAIYEPLDDVIPQKKTDGTENKKPKGYVTVTFDKGDHGALSGQTIYYVNPTKNVKLTAPTVTADLGFKQKANGEAWDKALEAKFTEDTTIKAQYDELKDFILKTKNDESEKPKGYVTVKLIPTNKATDATEKIYFVNPTKNVTITNKPVGTTIKDANGITYDYTFTGWTVTKGAIASWNTDTIAGTFIQDTEITAQYTTNVKIGKLTPAPVPKKNAVTPINEKPNPEDLIGNPYNPQDLDNKDNLPNGTKITYEKEPDVTNPGNSTAKVKIEYPNGKTTIIDVPVTVVKNVVPQVGNDKPLVPDSYVKVTVDTTDTATDNTKFVKVFWVKPNEEVTVPGILDPTGKPETEGSVTKTNNFKQWKLVGSNPEKTYKHGSDIKDTFTAKESTIVATYEQDKNVEPKPNNNRDVAKGSTPSAKDFIKNIYDDSDPNNKNNLPAGTRFDFDGNVPDTSTPVTNKKTKIKVTYPNGETKTVDVTYNVTEDVVEQTNPNQKPDVPDRFVEVIVKTTEDGVEKATEDTKFERTFWVDPNKEVTISVGKPTGKVGENAQGKTVQWQFTGWNKPLKGKFTGETTITALYEEVPQVPGSVGDLVTEEGIQPTLDQYKGGIQPPEGKKIKEVKIVEKPDVSKPGASTAKLKVTYTDGTSSDVTMRVFVQRKPQGDWQTGTLGSTRILTVVEKEVVKVPAEKAFRKEVRYMQGFNNYFRPTEGLTRAEAAQILANALVEDGYRYDPNFTIRYKDIVGNEWYAKAIRITSQANVFKGYDTGYFDPHKRITRAEWIGTLRRFQELERAPGNHMQVRPDHWAMGEIEAAYKEGWLAIYGQGLARFNADEFIPRQEVAAVSNKAFNRVLDKTYIHRNSKNLINYKDVNPSMWSYEDILCASNGYLHDGKSFWGHKIDYKKDLYNINLDGYTVTKDKFQRLERRQFSDRQKNPRGLCLGGFAVWDWVGESLWVKEFFFG